jgi:hypothetical protein
VHKIELIIIANESLIAPAQALEQEPPLKRDGLGVAGVVGGGETSSEALKAEEILLKKETDIFASG